MSKPNSADGTLPVPTVLIDPDALFRSALRILLGDTAFPVVADAGAPDRSLLETAEIRLVLLDPRGLDGGVRGIAGLRAAMPDARIVVLASSAPLDAVTEAFSAGADGFLLKSITPAALVGSIRLVMMGEKVFPATLAGQLASAADGTAADGRTPEFTGRELAILECLLDGCSNKMIAWRLGLTEATVKVHLQALLRRIGATNRTQAAIWALGRGIGTDAEPGLHGTA